MEIYVSDVIFLIILGTWDAQGMLEIHFNF